MISLWRKFADVAASHIAGLRLAPALLLVFASTCGSTNAQVVNTPHVVAELIARHTTFQPGQPIEAALRLKIIDHWHTYWRNPGDSGLPTRLKWSLPAGFTAGEIEWPYPKKLPLGPLMNFGYEGEVLHLVTIQTPQSGKVGNKVTLSAKADWLVCADVCIPEEGNVTLTLAAGNSPPTANPKWANAFASARGALPAGQLQGISVAVDGLFATISGKTQLDGAGSGMMFYPYRDDVIANAGQQVLSKNAEGFSLRIPLADPRNNELKTLDGVLVSEGDGTTWGGLVSNGVAKAVAINAPVSYGPGANTNSPIGRPFQAKLPENAQADLSLISAIALAFLGGLVLNLMPCVFPVLGIKVMGFVANAHGEAPLLRRQGAAYFVGVLASFGMLAGLMLLLRGAGQSVGWGFQMQEPLFVAALAVLFFLMALNLSGVFEFGTSIQAAAGNAELSAQGNPLVGAFTSGVLATVVATPCMAPGLGASIGFTISQSAPVAMLIFAAMAIGLALPVSLLSFFPTLLRYLPKPGAWMDGFKQFMAFPLYATVVWLVWILGAQTGNDGVAKLLLGLTLLGLGAWIYGRTQITIPAFSVVAGAVIVAIGVGMAWSGANTMAPAEATATSGDWVPFSKEKIASLRAEGKSVFVDFTATWCITCQVNKRVALNDDTVVAQMKSKNVVRMKADWTRKDAAITQALADFGRNGVPLYVFYPATGEPVILPELLTPQLVVDALSAQSVADRVAEVAGKSAP
jgi:thiol:disulfide interchange protein DsbD